MLFPLIDDNRTARMPWVTIGLIVINVLSFLSLINRGPVQRQDAIYRRGFVPARLAQLQTGQPLILDMQQDVPHPMLRNVVLRRKFQIRLEPDPVRIVASMVTSLFLHGGWMHLIGNMWFFWVFGNNVEDRLGPVSFLVFYLIGGVAASLCHWATDPASTVPVVGASGAVAAVMGAYAITWPRARVSTLLFLVIFFTIIELPAMVVLGFWFLIQLLEGQKAIQMDVSGGVAWWAHVGGFVVGVALMPLWCSFVEPPIIDSGDESSGPVVR